MNRYTGTKCPHCLKAFTENDIVVVCPECGAPYHRSCFEEMGGTCKFADKHAEGFNWNTDEKKQQGAEQRFEGGSRVIRCSRCGTLNSDQNIFCDVCGTPLRQPTSTFHQSFEGSQQNSGPSQGPTGPFRAMGYNPYTTPYGGLNPDEEIDGIPVKELAIYIGESTHYYLPKFKELKTTGHNVINWSGFFLEFIFLVYRKMYLAAALVFLIPNLLSTGMMLIFITGNFINLTAETYSFISMITYAISIAVRFFVGFSFNRLYMGHCFKKIRALKERYGDNQALYYEQLTKAGSVSQKATIIVLVLYILLTMAVFYLSVFFSSVI